MNVATKRRAVALAGEPEKGEGQQQGRWPGC